MHPDFAVLLALLRAGLWEEPVVDLSCFPLDAVAWERVFTLARQQTVQGVVYEGICRLPDDCLPPDSLLFRWVAEVDALERRNRFVNGVLEELNRWFTSHNLHPVLQKGQGVASFYRQPLRRVSGDIDFYFPSQAEFSRALQLLSQRGISFSRAADGSVYYSWKEVVVEHHATLFDVSSPSAQSRLRRWEQAEGFREWKLPSGNGSVRVPSDALNLLLLSTHIRKHAFGWGIGLRQLCDYACACRALQVDPVSFRKQGAALGLCRWQGLLHAFVQQMLGVPSEFVPTAGALVSCVPLLKVVQQGGNFGQLRRQSASELQAGSASHGLVRRKLRTAGALFSSLVFSFRYGAGEAFWMWIQLLKGQWKS